MNTTLSAAADDDRPPLPPGDHPIESKQYVICTPAIEAMCSQVVQLINNRTPGGVFWARPQTGKSHSLQILRLECETVFPGIPLRVVESWEEKIPREARFMEELLKAAGHAIVEKGKPHHKRDRAVELIAQQALESGTRRMILIFDEAQLLHEIQYKWLIGIHNLLARRGVNLITLLVGQHELTHQRSVFLRAGKENIVGRFMVQMFEFQGITTASELGDALAEYDVEEYPADSGWSYSRYYARHLFDAGWRLKKMAALLWGSFHQARKTAPPKKAAKQIKMLHFCRTVEHLLMNLHTIDAKSEDAVKQLMATAIAGSGYLNDLGLA